MPRVVFETRRGDSGCPGSFLRQGGETLDAQGRFWDGGRIFLDAQVRFWDKEVETSGCPGQSRF